MFKQKLRGFCKLIRNFIIHWFCWNLVKNKTILFVQIYRVMFLSLRNSAFKFFFFIESCTRDITACNACKHLNSFKGDRVSLIVYKMGYFSLNSEKGSRNRFKQSHVYIFWIHWFYSTIYFQRVRSFLWRSINERIL